MNDSAQQEPVAYWFDIRHDGKGKREQFAAIDFIAPPGVTVISKQPLYTSPPANADAGKPWVGLTDEEVLENWRKLGFPQETLVHFSGGALWAEAKLKEKNT